MPDPDAGQLGKKHAPSPKNRQGCSVTTDRARSLRTHCDTCGASGQLWLERQGRRLFRCSACGFAWVPEGVVRTIDGVSIYEDDNRALFEDFADYYQDASAGDAAAAKLDWVIRYVKPGGRLLDVGANYGHFVARAAKRFEAIGLEPSIRAVRWGESHLQAPVKIGSISDEYPEFIGRFQAITLFDVIEHLDNPRVAIERCRRYLAPGGCLFVTTPDAGSVVARLLGKRWYHLDLEQHVSIFSSSNLTRLLSEYGFVAIGWRRFGRRYRLSYIDRRLHDLGRENGLFSVARAVAFPLRLFPERRVSINLHDVTGLVAHVRP